MIYEGSNSSACGFKFSSSMELVKSDKWSFADFEIYQRFLINGAICLAKLCRSPKCTNYPKCNKVLNVIKS